MLMMETEVNKRLRHKSQCGRACAMSSYKHIKTSSTLCRHSVAGDRKTMTILTSSNSVMEYSLLGVMQHGDKKARVFYKCLADFGSWFQISGQSVDVELRQR